MISRRLMSAASLCFNKSCFEDICILFRNFWFIGSSVAVNPFFRWRRSMLNKCQTRIFIFIECSFDHFYCHFNGTINWWISWVRSKVIKGPLLSEFRKVGTINILELLSIIASYFTGYRVWIMQFADWFLASDIFWVFGVIIAHYKISFCFIIKRRLQYFSPSIWHCKRNYRFWFRNNILDAYFFTLSCKFLFRLNIPANKPIPWLVLYIFLFQKALHGFVSAFNCVICVQWQWPYISMSSLMATLYRSQ